MTSLRRLPLNPIGRSSVLGIMFFGLVLLALFALEGEWDVASATIATAVVVPLFYLADRHITSR